MIILYTITGILACVNTFFIYRNKVPPCGVAGDGPDTAVRLPADRPAAPRTPPPQAGLAGLSPAHKVNVALLYNTLMHLDYY